MALTITLSAPNGDVSVATVPNATSAAIVALTVKGYVILASKKV